ncbi:uncharacterized protein [Primulina huaijiensis]|uniref:uncharacterized protein n=1 Tax=Primulina huaijiensis TaxID=1492673 RepID=UPI003CC6E4F9
MAIGTIVAATLQGFVNPNANQPPPSPPAQNGTKQHYESLRRARVPNFDGSSDPEVGQNWMKEVENHLRLLEVPQKIKAFLRQYFPTAIRVQKLSEFESLVQEPNMSMVEYSSKFHSLGTYSPTIMGNEALKIHRFKKRLNSRIQFALAVIEPNSFDELMGAAIRAENDIKRREGDNKLKRPQSIQYQPGQQFKRPKFPNNQSTSAPAKEATSSQSSKEEVNYQSCGFAHTGECRRSSGACFSCGKMDHRIAQCPFLDPRNGPEGGTTPNKPKENKLNARVYALTQEDADNSNDVVAGTILINNIPAYVLFDCGATHSFMSKRFAKKLGAKPDNLEEPYRVAIPANRILETRTLYQNISVLIENQNFKANLIELKIVEFDVILGMDRLAKNYALVYCHEKTLAMLSEGKEETTLALEEISVLQEFPNVFPEEHPGTIPDREVEFEINLVLNATPISKASYRMAPAELKEHKDQLQELLDKKQIRPSPSPWELLPYL